MPQFESIITLNFCNQHACLFVSLFLPLTLIPLVKIEKHHRHLLVQPARTEREKKKPFSPKAIVSYLSPLVFVR